MRTVFKTKLHSRASRHLGYRRSLRHVARTGFTGRRSPYQRTEHRGAGCCAVGSIGIIVFTGSLFALVILDKGWLGAITPAGGILLITGWLIMFRNALLAQAILRPAAARVRRVDECALTAVDVGINLSCTQIRMTEHCLNGS